MHTNIRINLMPVITPAYPARNCAATVTATTKYIILKEIRRAHEILMKAATGPVVWREMYEPAPFFDLYSQYLVVNVYARSPEIKIKVMAYVETKLHDFLRMLENIPGLGMHPHPKRFGLDGVDADFPHGCALYVALASYRNEGSWAGEYVDLRQSLRYLLTLLRGWPERAPHEGKYYLKCRRLWEGCRLTGHSLTGHSLTCHRLNWSQSRG